MKKAMTKSELEIALEMTNFAPANFLGEFIEMPTTNEEARKVTHLKNIHTGKLFEANQTTRQVNHHIEWRLNNG